MNGDMTLIVATRSRSLNIVRFWESFVKTVADKSKVNVLFLTDEDDLRTAQTIKNRCPDARALCGPRENVPIRINAAWPEVKSDVVGLFGDDIVFQTAGWDRRVMQSFMMWEDEVGVVYGSDGWQNEKLCTHPFLSRRWVETLGYLAHDGFFHYCVDTWTHDVAKRVGRLSYMSDVLFEHMHPDAGKAPADEVRRSRTRYFAHDVSVFEATVKQREEDAAKLLKVMR